MSIEDFRAMLAERNDLFRNPTFNGIRAFFKKWNGANMPNDKTIVWATLHKARCMWNLCPQELRAESVFWLHEHGMRAPDPETGNPR